MPAPDGSEALRGLRLERTVRLCAGWLLAQGAVCLGLNVHLAALLRMRFDPAQQPYVRLAGLSLLCLGFFLVKALRDPRRQYLAVDVLILFLLGQVYLLLDFRLGAQLLTPWEWASGAADLGLCASLVLNRTRSGQMDGEATVFSAKAADLARQTRLWVSGRGPAPKPSLGSLAPKGESGEGGAPRKGESEALPHMD